MIQLLAQQEDRSRALPTHFLSIRRYLLTLVLAGLVANSAIKARAFSIRNEDTAPSTTPSDVVRPRAKSAAAMHKTNRKPLVDVCASQNSSLNSGVCQGSRHAAVEVPEPASLFLVGVGLISIGALVRRRIVRRQSR